jgi:hypothetical protein
MVAISARKKTSAFFRSKGYILLIMLATLGAWVAKIPYIAIAAYCAAMLVIVLLEKEMTGMVPIVLCAPFIFAESSLLNTREMTIMLSVLIGVYLICCLIYYEKQKLVMHFNRGLIAFLLLGLALLAGGLINKQLFSRGWFVGLQIILGMTSLYILLCNLIKTNWKLFFTQSLVGASIVVMAQFWLSLILGGGDFFDNLVAGGFNLGWGDASAVAMALIVLAPFSLYLAMRARRPLAYSILYALNLTTILATGESLALLVMIVFTVIMLSYGLVRARKPKRIIAQLAAIGVIVIALLLAFPLVTPVLTNALKPGLGDVLINWEIALTEFINGEKLLGNGFGFNSPFSGGGVNILWYNSSILQVLNNLGIVGLVLFAGFTVYKYILIGSSFSVFSKMSAFALMAAGAYAALSTNYFKAYHLLPMVILLFIAYNDMVIRTRGDYGIKRYRLRLDNYRFVYGKSNKYKEKIKVANPNYKYYKLKLETKGKFFDEI